MRVSPLAAPAVPLRRARRGSAYRTLNVQPAMSRIESIVLCGDVFWPAPAKRPGGERLASHTCGCFAQGAVLRHDEAVARQLAHCDAMARARDRVRRRLMQSGLQPLQPPAKRDLPRIEPEG